MVGRFSQLINLLFVQYHLKQKRGELVGKNVDLLLAVLILNSTFYHIHVFLIVCTILLENTKVLSTYILFFALITLNN